MLVSVLLVGSALLSQVDVEADVDLKQEVTRLYYQLNAPSLSVRDAAEKKLLGLGPDVLDLLPPSTSRTPAETRQRIGRLRDRLQRSAAQSAAKASEITLRGNAMPLSKVIEAMQQQSGNKIVDYRRQFGQETNDPKLDVDFNKVPFWKALDRVLDQAELGIYPYGEERAIHLVDRQQGLSARAHRGVYSGPLRIEPTQVIAQRDLRDPTGQVLRVMLEVAWEPRLKPISLTQTLADITAVDENGNSLTLPDKDARMEVPVGEAIATELTIPLRLPPRDTKRIASLKGRLGAVIPGKIETFTFKDLTKAKDVDRRIGGVVVTLEGVRKNNSVWTVRIRVHYDNPGEAFQSHRGWVDENEAYLLDPDNKPIKVAMEETTGQNEEGVGTAYGFVLDGTIDGHKFVYKTPGAIIATHFDYEIKGLQLP